jgi:hypothetical protein
MYLFLIILFKTELGPRPEPTPPSWSKSVVPVVDLEEGDKKLCLKDLTNETHAGSSIVLQPTIKRTSLYEVPVAVKKQRRQHCDFLGY